MSALSAARQTLDDLRGLTWSRWSAPDLTDISTMLSAVEAADAPAERHSLAELEEDFGSTTYDIPRDCLLARDDAGDVVALARSVCNDSDRTVRRALLMGAVRPDWRGAGLGRAITDWEIEHARAWYREHYQPEHEVLRISMFSDSKVEREHRLAQRFGLERVRVFAELTLHLTSRVVVPDVPGIELRPWHHADPQTTLAVRNATFRDHWGSVPTPLTSWLEQQESASFRPRWSFLAVDTAGDQVVAFLLASAYEQDWAPQGYTCGYVDLLGTLREHRGRGIGTALIRRAMRAFQLAGLDAAGIGVDAQNESGAFGLYRGLGFEQTSGTVQFTREERLAP